MKIKGKFKLKCRLCGKTYYRYKSTVGPLCGKKCVDDEKRNGSTLKCVRCGKKFYRRFGEQQGTKLSFCSIKCYQQHRISNAKATTYLKFGSRHRHIVIVENHIGRKLRKGEIVHHIDLNKQNNKLNNLCLLPSQAIHTKIHFSKRMIDIKKYRLL